MKRKTGREKKKIGIIGTGVLGGYITGKFLKKGYSVFIYDPNGYKVKKYTDRGAILCAAPKEVTLNADIIFEITRNDETSKRAWLEKDGILRGATADKVLIVCSTLSADWVDTLAGKCQTQGLRFFDMGVSGGDHGFTLLCGGDENLLKEITPVLRVFAAKKLHFGPAGQGMRAKLILNFLQAVHIIGFRQAMRMAEAYSMNPEVVGEALALRPGGALTEIAREFYLYKPNDVIFKIELITKDLSYAKKLVGNLDIPLLDNVYTDYKTAAVNGHAKKDWMSIVTLDD